VNEVGVVAGVRVKVLAIHDVEYSMQHRTRELGRPFNPRVLWENGVDAGAQKGWDLLRNVGIHPARKQSEPGRMQKNAVRRLAQHLGALCQNSSKTALQAVPVKKFCRNGEVAAARIFEGVLERARLTGRIQ